MSVAPSIVLAFDVWIVLVLARRARDVLFRWPLERGVAARVAERGPSALAVLASEGGEAAWARLARAVGSADGDEPGDRLVALEDALGDLRDEIVGRGVGGHGLASPRPRPRGAAAQAARAREPPLLALDPDRVLDGSFRRVFCPRLDRGVDALAGLYFLRPRALELLAGADRLAEMARAAPDAAWTSAPSK